MVYHVLNRANGRLQLFRKDEDFLAFENVLIQAMRRVDRSDRSDRWIDA